MSEKDWLVIAAALLVLFSLGSLGMMGYGGMMGGWGGWSSTGSWGFWPFHLILGLLFLGAVVWIFSKGVGGLRPVADAKAVLKERLAHGEISLTEYRSLSKVIEHD